MRAKLIHILGAGAWQLPSIRLAKRLGYRVLVSDIYDERPGYAIADDHAVIDITDVDSTFALARERKIDGIICDTTDVGVPTMAYVAEVLGLPGIGYETALNFTNKYRMRQRTAAAGIPNPPFRLATSSNAAAVALDIGFPCVFKPVDSQSSRGVGIARDLGQVAGCYNAARAATRSNVIVEGYLPGREITVEGYCVDGEPTAACISDKDHFSDLPVAHRLTYPAALSLAQRSAILETNSRVVRSLGLKTGVTHAEYMLDGHDVALVEIAARGGGNHVYSDILPTLAGQPIPAMYLRFALGEGWSAGGAIARAWGRAQAANLAFFRFPPGHVAAIDGIEQARRLPGVRALELQLVPGAVVPLVQDDRSRHGFVLIFGASRQEVLERTTAVYQVVRAEIDGTWCSGIPE